ncbi:MAG: bifunctional 3-deoxy-7-phosphoheptulonate synthase/chorismate mutase [Halanaerobiales bacterium]|nr:bifunctional 3-deoxy-7-phosphoheptulonate synthase/chorismate mutase [Halanaerobiales bacterium]
MIIFSEKHQDLNQNIKILKEKDINYLIRNQDNKNIIIIISDLNKELKNILTENLKYKKILIDDSADQYLNKNRYIKYKENTLFQDGTFEIIAGPCSIENKKQMEIIGINLAKLDIKFIRGGAFKPRTSPYDFQGLQKEGLELLKSQAKKHDFFVITEVMESSQIELINNYTDIFQIGSRNMYNYSLLKKIGNQAKPVLLKRGMSASYEEFILAAEYIQSQGNKNIILCERGIRTFEKKTRFTLDLMAVPILKKLADYPIIVDPSHGTGRWDLIKPAVMASYCTGAQGVMIEVHPDPDLALSDGFQSLNIDNFKDLINRINMIEGF